MIKSTTSTYKSISRPSNKPAMVIINELAFVVLSSSTFFSVIANAAANMNTAKTNRKKLLAYFYQVPANTGSGMAGTISVRVIKIDAIDGIPKKYCPPVDIADTYGSMSRINLLSYNKQGIACGNNRVDTK